MSFLSFLGRGRASNVNKAALSITDILHRTFVTGLAALTAYGIFLGYAVHRETLAKGREVNIMAVREAEARAREEATAADEAREQALAEAAQSAFRK
ncbi:hypothetical protein BJ138DRAFT_1113247 [Hygrophoropsis aurantiaca]|uniref:Uncharacterized protein n=1 Tax=Hygrophoropsis aurantiaca TaxID=72124 RepID=A0ACB8ADA4_9AGAM|nr:hypothetical protein BJ138DRAFT_1113247 [Hygrophoropsis aurantiaca]